MTTQPDDSIPLSALDLTDADTWPEFMTTEEVSHVLRLNKQTVLAAIARGALPERGWASSKRISKRDLLASNLVATPTPEGDE